MATISTNCNPGMTRYLIENTDIFKEDPITIVDVGARWGYNAEWDVFKPYLHVYCFEPDAEECKRLNATSEPYVKYLPYALGRDAGEAVLYEAKLSASTGLYKTNSSYFSRLLNRDNGITVAETTLTVHTLTEALQEFGVESIDFIKLDVEGAELDVLQGGKPYVEHPALVGILTEVRFQEEINGCPIFWQMDQHVRQSGFRLYDLKFHYQSRHALPYPGLANYRTTDGQRFFAYTTHGQMMDGDALYFRDLLVPANRQSRASASVSRLLKAAAFYELYCLNDCAAELIIEHREQLASKVDCDRLLDLLTPPAANSQGYKAYVARYFDPNRGVIAAATPGCYATAATPGLAGRILRRLKRMLAG